MIEEIKTDNNCIIKAFENCDISILQENTVNNDRKTYYFKASDIGKALNLANIRQSIQNYDSDEQVVRKAYDLRGCEQDTTFLSSQGVYRLLYNSKKEAGPWNQNSYEEPVGAKRRYFELGVLKYY